MSNSIQPNPDTAYIIDDIITQLNVVKTMQDNLLALSEFAIGFALSQRDIDICLGFNIVTPLEQANISNDLVFGQGLYKTNNTIDVFPPKTEVNVENPYKISIVGNSLTAENSNAVDYYVTEYGVDNVLSEIGNIKLQDTYLFGAIYFDTTSIVTKILKGTTGDYVKLFRDLSEDEISLFVTSNFNTLYSAPGVLPNGSIEIFRFIISIDYYGGLLTDKNNRYKIIPIDIRKNRNWSGLAEEYISSILIPSILIYKNDFNESLAISEAKVNLLVNKWIGLSWVGGFDKFWDGSVYTLPDGLHDYIYN